MFALGRTKPTREQAEGGRTHEQLRHGRQLLQSLQLVLHQVGTPRSTASRLQGTGTGAIPNRNGPEVDACASLQGKPCSSITLSKALHPHAVKEL